MGVFILLTFRGDVFSHCSFCQLSILYIPNLTLPSHHPSFAPLFCMHHPTHPHFRCSLCSASLPGPPRPLWLRAPPRPRADPPRPTKTPPGSFVRTAGCLSGGVRLPNFQISGRPGPGCQCWRQTSAPPEVRYRRVKPAIMTLFARRVPRDFNGGSGRPG